MASATELSDFAARWARFDGPGRLAGVDLARGLAVVGMLAAHLLRILPFSPGDPESWLDVVNGRSSILFATLAGLSIGLVTGGTIALRGSARLRASGRLAIRGGLLWVLGLLLVLTGVPVYVILPAYGILFLLTLPFLGMRARTLFAIAGSLALITPWLQAGLDSLPLWQTGVGEQIADVIGWHYPFPVWIAFVLAGLGLGRCDLGSAWVAAVMLVTGTALAVLGYSLTTVVPPGATGLVAEVWTAAPHSSGLLEVVGSGGFAVAIIGLCLLVCRTPLRWAAIPLRAVGAMPLTAYTVQLLVWVAVAMWVLGDVEDLFGFRDLQLFWPMTLSIVTACTMWTVFVGRGPLEAAIDRVARWVVPRRSA